MGIYILIPSYNPREVLLELLGEIYPRQKNILLVNDGSVADGSVAIFNKARQQFPGIEVLHHPHNQGKGNALRTGFSYILKNFPGHDILIADDDGQHTAKDILYIAALSNKKPNEVYMGVRNFANTPWKSALGNKVASFLIALLYKKKLTDTQSGLRAIPHGLVPEITALPGDRYDYEPAVLIHLIRSKFPVNYIPIDTVYIENNRHSSFRPIVDSAKVLRIIFKSYFS